MFLSFIIVDKGKEIQKIVVLIGGAKIAAVSCCYRDSNMCNV